MAAHNFYHLYAVRRAASRRVDHLGGLSEILRANRGRRDQTERRRVLLSIVVKPVNDAARNAERLSRPDVDLLPVHGPGQHSSNAVDRLFVMVMAVGRSRQALRAWNYDLKCRDVSARILAGNQKANQLPFSPHGRQEGSQAFLSDGTDQQEADDKHHRAGYAMNGERSRLRPARPQND